MPDDTPIKMDDYTAVAIAEGFYGDDFTPEDEIAAWQYLHDTRLGYKLQGWFGRSLQYLIEIGEINA